MNNLNARPSLRAHGEPAQQPTTDAKVLQNLDSTASSIGFASIDLNGTITFSNHAFDRLLRYSTASTNQSIIDQISLEFRASVVEFRHKIKQTGPAIVQLQANREAPLVRLRLDSIQNAQRIVVAECTSETADQLEENYKQTHLDPLTQLGNRRLLTDMIEGWHPTDEDNQCLGLIMMDLDRFKQVNDTLGHEAGDALLKLVAERAKRAARTDDTIVRLGGDEFIILQSLNNKAAGPEAVAKRLVELMGRPFLVTGQQINIGTSVGIAILNHGTERIEDLMKHADLALYDAKAAGRGTYRAFNPELEKKALERRELELRLRRALGLKEFELVYQPQVDLVEGKLMGFEALIRWNTADRGIIPPVDFIPLAEETGDILAIGEWVLRTACIEAATWSDDLCVAVNVSPVQFENPSFIGCIQSVLSISGLAANRLEIEITEGVLITNVENALNHLWALQSMGVEIAMDDFGTGYSSLSYLTSFPFSKIKIDQSFVIGNRSEKSQALIDAIITLGDSLGMKTLAEGVETEAQFNQLSEGGCKQAQGYLFSKPLPANEVNQFIANYSEHPKTNGDLP